METKICSSANCIHRGKPQPIANFRNRKASPDGKAPQCNDCMRVYAQRYKENGGRKQVLDKYTKTDKFKATQKRFSQTDKYKANKKKYVQSERGKAKSQERDRENTIRYQVDPEHRKKVLARCCVNYHVQAGNIPSVSTLVCKQCNKPATEYHHYLGYERKHWLDIEPYCTKCHRNLG